MARLLLACWLVTSANKSIDLQRFIKGFERGQSDLSLLFFVEKRYP